MELVYVDDDIIVCIKPFGALSTDEEGGVPSLAREALGDAAACVKTVHRLDRVVGGLMLLARSPESARALSAQISGRDFQKRYMAVLHGCPEQPSGRLTDLLARDPRERKTYVATQPGKGVQEAVLDYRVTGRAGGLSRVEIALVTGRTHQIRAQFSSRGLPLVGDRKYSLLADDCPIALWSCRLSFTHPTTGRQMDFDRLPPEIWPWTAFSA